MPRRIEDDNPVLKDGETLIVRLTAMDALERDVTARVNCVDAYGHPAGHAPGYVFRADQASEVRDNAFEQYDERVSNAWRGEGQPAEQISRGVDAVDAAYETYENQLTNAWRVGR